MACPAGGFKGLEVYGEGNYGERNEKDVYNIIRRRREKIRDAAGRRGKCGREKPPAAKPSVF